MLNEEIYNEIANNILEKENSLKQYACKSEDAIYFDEIKNDLRPSFFRDIDRIIHTSSYTRYMDKTQVFVEKVNDNITRRMVHVQLVSKIGRTIGRFLNLNEDLIEASGLGHDVGHVPFGHFGERVLDKISRKENEGIFMHNVQSVRTFIYIENNGKGSNLTLQTLDGILCHNGELLQDYYQPNYSKTKQDFMQEYIDSYNTEIVQKKLIPMTLEGCVTRISDIIAYIGRDIEDAINLGVITREQLPESIIKILGNENKSIINQLILDIVKNSYGKPYLKMSESVYNALIDLKKYNYDNIYYVAMTDKQKNEYEQIFNKLFYLYLDEIESNKQVTDFTKEYLSKMSNEYLSNTSNKRKVLDYISGMTDSFLLNQYDKYCR